MKRIVFRADGSSDIGMGHVMRCVALSQMLRQDAQIAFAAHAPDAGMEKLMNTLDLPLIKVSDQLDRIYAQQADAVVVDGYWANAAYIQGIKQAGKKIIQVDDLAGPEFFADLVLNHAVGTDYSASVFHNKGRLLSGSKYAMLRQEFLEFKKQNRSFSRINSVLLNMGGADPYNYTLTLLRAWKASATLLDIQMNVLIGQAYGHKAELKAWIKNHPDCDIHLHENLDARQIIDLLSTIDLFICPASTVVYEAAAVGVPTACFLTADNQENIYKGLADTGSVTTLGNLTTFQHEELVGIMSNLPAAYREITEGVSRQRELIDGLSGQRIKQAIFELWN